MALPDNQLARYQVELIRAEHIARPHDHDTGWRTLPLLLALEVCKGTFQCDTRGLPRVVLDRPAHWILLPPEQEHRIWIKPGDGSAITRWVLLQANYRDGRSVFGEYRFPQTLSGKPGMEFSGLMNALFRARKHDSPEAACEVQAAAYHLMASLFRHAEKIREPHPRWKELSPVLVRIRQHLHEPWDRVRMAELAGLSPTRFDQVFKEVTGQTPSTWLQKERVSQAKKLMLSSELPIHQISLLVGFEDPYHFSRFFKRHVGHSPSHWKESRVR